MATRERHVVYEFQSQTGVSEVVDLRTATKCRVAAVGGTSTNVEGSSNYGTILRENIRNANALADKTWPADRTPEFYDLGTITGSDVLVLDPCPAFLRVNVTGTSNIYVDAVREVD